MLYVLLIRCKIKERKKGFQIGQPQGIRPFVSAGKEHQDGMHFFV
jgi:hypothetical protein